MGKAYARAVGARLRAIRQQQGLSLRAVEIRSRGRWKAVRVGSYERGERGVSAQHLQELADFYGVPITALVPGEAPLDPGSAEATRLVIDLPRLAELAEDQAGPLRQFTAAIQAQRGDHHQHLLTIRDTDLRTLSLLYNAPRQVLLDRFGSWGVLYTLPPTPSDGHPRS